MQSDSPALPIEELSLGVRSYNCFKREGIDTIGQLATMTREDLTYIRNLGERGVDEIDAKLAESGYHLEDEEE